MHGRVALVTDSTSCIPAELAEQWGIGIVPIQIKIGERIDTENRVPTHVLIDALTRNLAVSTAAPDPAASTGPTSEPRHWAPTRSSRFISPPASRTPTSAPYRLLPSLAPRSM